MENYEIFRKLASQGACGAVYFARDKRNENRTVVVKQLPASDSRSAIERRVMRNLRHSNVVRYLDSWMSMEDGSKFTQQQQQLQQLQQQQQQQQAQQDANNNTARVNKAVAAAAATPSSTKPPERQLTLNIAMEYCKGGDLRTAIRARRTTEGVGFPEDVIRKWIVQICSALYYIHIQHMLHRDLKSENVLLDETGSCAKLADFGFAKELAESTAFATTRLGTPHSLPPEVYDFTPYNNRADMWCVGVILYELMTLQRPFLGQTTRELFDNILKSDPPPAEQASRSRYSPELYLLQKRLLSKNPKNRPSAREILEYAWASSMLREVRLLPLSEEQRAKERSAWERITVMAQFDKTVVMELALPSTSVNVRNAPDFERSKVIAQLQQGDIIEVIDEIVDASDLRWFRTTKGFCIKMTPMPPTRDMFRRIAEWRICRPSSSTSSSSSSSSTAHALQQQNCNQIAQGAIGGGTNKLLSATPTFTSPSSDENDTKSSDEAAKNALETQIKAEDMATAAAAAGTTTLTKQQQLGAANRFLITSLLNNGVPEETLQDMLQRYADLATPVDDMPWTMYCVDALRPLKMVPWIPVIRTVALSAAELRITTAAAPACAGASPTGAAEQQQQQTQQQAAVTPPATKAKARSPPPLPKAAVAAKA